MSIGLSEGEDAMSEGLSEDQGTGFICAHDGLSLYVLYLRYPQHLLCLLYRYIQHATV